MNKKLWLLLSSILLSMLISHSMEQGWGYRSDGKEYDSVGHQVLRSIQKNDQEYSGRSKIQQKQWITKERALEITQDIKKNDTHRLAKKYFNISNLHPMKSYPIKDFLELVASGVIGLESDTISTKILMDSDENKEEFLVSGDDSLLTFANQGININCSRDHLPQDYPLVISSALCALRNIKKISISGAESISPDIFQLSNLVSLWVQNSPYAVPLLLKALSELRLDIQLKQLVLTDNKLSSINPAILRQLINLQLLDLSENQLFSVPATITVLSKLTSLFLSRNNISTLPKDMIHMTNLTCLCLIGSIKEWQEKNPELFKYQSDPVEKLDRDNRQKQIIVDEKEKQSCLRLMNLQKNEMDAAIEQFLPKLLFPVEECYPDLFEMKEDLNTANKWIVQSKNDNYYDPIAQYVSEYALGRKYFNIQNIPYDAWFDSNNLITKLMELIACGVIDLYSKPEEGCSYAEGVLFPKIMIYCRLHHPYEFHTANFSGLKEIVEKCISLAPTGVLLSKDYIFTIPDGVSLLKNLKTVSISSICSEVKSISPELFELPQLTDLSLCSFEKNPHVLPPLLEHLITCTGLTSLNLSSNKLVAIPTTISSLTNLKKLNLNFNQLSTLPSVISVLSNLKRLWLTENKISTLPISNCSKLTVLGLGYNNLSNIPYEVFSLTNLKNLSFPRNKLTSIPDSLFALTNLKRLDLSENQLSTVSSDIEELYKLKELLLNKNPIIVLPNNMGSRYGLKLGLGDAMDEGFNYLSYSAQGLYKQNPELFSGT